MEANGGGIYIGGTGKREGKEGGKGIENKKLPITADRNPFPFIQFLLLSCSIFFFFFWMREEGRVFITTRTVLEINCFKKFALKKL